MKNNIKLLIDDLLRRGITKWKIKNMLGVHWTTVQSWYKGHKIPNKEHYEKLKQIYKRYVSK